MCCSKVQVLVEGYQQPWTLCEMIEGFEAVIPPEGL